MFIIKNNKKGFSILEVTVALGLLMMGLLGIVSLIVQNSQARNINKNYLIASMLAQEGAELVRNIRDENWLQNRPSWATGDDGDTDIVQDGSYAIDRRRIIDGTATNITDDKARLYLNGGFYDHNNTGVLTPFFRLVTVDSSGLPDSIVITVKVQWQERGRTHDYDVVMELYDWR